MKDSLGQKIGLGFGAAILALVLIGGAAWWSAARFKGTAYWVNHTHEVMNALERLQTDVLAMQANVRGFVLTGDEAILKPYQADDQDVDNTLGRLRELMADNPQQLGRLAEIEPYVAQARQVMRGRIEKRRGRGLDAVGEAPFLLQGQRAVEAIRGLVGAMETEERRLLNDRFQRMNVIGRLSVVTILLVSLLAIVLLITAGGLLRRQFIRREQMAQVIRDSEERLRLMISSVTDYAIIQLDPTGKIVGWNSGAQRIKGYETGEIVGQQFAKFYPPEMIATGFPGQMLARATSEGRVEDEGWRVRRDGSRFWAHVVVTAVRDSDGALLGFVKLTHDLTERRAAQQKIEDLNGDLQRRANALETANQELEAFSYSVSHDLRAPLRHIDGFANLLSKHAEAKLDDQSRRYLNTISRSARQMGTLIDDLLAFSRIGRTALHVEAVDQMQLVREVVQEAQYDGLARPPAWEIADLPAAGGDPALLRQVWRNLLDNAVKYSGKADAPRIIVSGHTDATRREHVYCVRDNGVGFDMAYADKLFGVFQRLHSPSDFEGTGIGLANVRRIVGRHGGRTWAEAQPDAGAAFYFSLPIEPIRPSPTS